MIIIKHPSALQEFIAAAKASGTTVGFVPTMGALHAGHLDLVKTSKSDTGLTVCSIFINPTQFNDPADFKKYPQTLENDIKLLEQEQADVLFLPDTGDIYPHGLNGLELYRLGYLESILEGKYRPGHFQGVCQVMSRLLKMVQPDQLFMGQKDYQQCMVVEKLLQLIDLKVRLVKCPTVRESDGLAMSSRNLRLSPAQRSVAPAIYQALKTAALQIGKDDFSVLADEAKQSLEKQGLRPDYFEIADRSTLEPANGSEPDSQLVILAAAYLGEIRLIDNVLPNFL